MSQPTDDGPPRHLHLVTGDTASGERPRQRRSQLVVTGRAKTGKTETLIRVAQEHLADGGTLWVYAHSGPAMQVWQDRLKIIHWAMRDLADLADQAFNLVTVIKRRAEVRGGNWPPVMLVIDELLPYELNAEPHLADDLVRIVRTGSSSNVWLAAAAQRLNQPELIDLRHAFEAVGACCHCERSPQPTT